MPNRSLVSMNAFLMYKLTEMRVEEESETFRKTYGRHSDFSHSLFLEIPAPRLWPRSKGSSMAMQGEFHIFSNLVSGARCRMHTTRF